MEILGVDWGEKRIGLAIGEGSPFGGLAEPVGVVGSVEELFDFIKEKRIGKVVLGLPEGRYQKRVRQLGKKIKEELGVEVILRDETLSTRGAQEVMIRAGKGRKKRAQNLDAAAAAFLLQEYLDQEKPSLRGK